MTTATATLTVLGRELPGLSRFWSKVRFTESCWEWTGAKIPTGYGSFGDRSGHTMKSHRYSFQQHFGDIPSGMVVMHKCDNRACVNPEHLVLGTQQENVRDCVVKNRKGMKLSVTQVREIRRRFRAGETQTAIAKDFGVQQPAISRVVHGVNWGHLS